VVAAAGYPRRVATRDDVRRLALALPESEANEDGTVFSVAGKSFAWPWQERIHPKRARMPNLDVLAVRVASEFEKEVLIEMDPDVFFTEPHYDGYPAILVRLPMIGEDLLGPILADAWRTHAPKRLLRDDGRPKP
jgi:hypothetical protein